MCTKPVSHQVQQTIVPSAKTGGSRKHAVNTQGQDGRWAAANQHSSPQTAAPLLLRSYPDVCRARGKLERAAPRAEPAPQRFPFLYPSPPFPSPHYCQAPAPTREEEDASCHCRAAPASLSPSAELDATMISARAATVAAASPASPVRSTSGLTTHPSTPPSLR